MTRSTADHDALIPAPRACVRLGVSRRTLSRLIARGEIRALKMGVHQRARVYVRETELRRYMDGLARA